MNVLFLPHRLPFPPNKGDKIRSYHLLRHLLANHVVYLGTFVDQHKDWTHAKTVSAMVDGRCFLAPLTPAQRYARAGLAIARGTSISSGCYADKGLHNWVQGLLTRGEIDCAIVFSTAMAPYLLDAPINAPRVILDMVDVDSDKWRQYAFASSGIKRWVFGREAKTLKALEARATREFFATVLVSEFEAATLREEVADVKDKIMSVPNGVDLSFFAPEGVFKNPFDANELPIVMTGQMDYRPNWEGALWFEREVLPLVRSKHPAARFYVVGADPPAQLRKLTGPAVTVTGAVSDIRPYLKHARVAVAPLQMARGVQNKVLEAMAMGKPVVATSPATRALQVTSGVELLITDGPHEFGRAVCSALSSEIPVVLAQNARAHVERAYSWTKNLSLFDELIQKVSSHKRFRSAPQPAGLERSWG